MAVVDIRLTPGQATNVASAPHGRIAIVSARATWEAITTVQRTGEDREAALEKARAAGRRAVRKFGPALDRLGE
jgi:hypothetical protein